MKLSKTPFGWLLSSFVPFWSTRADGREAEPKRIPIGWTLLILILFSLIVWTLIFKLFFH